MGLLDLETPNIILHFKSDPVFAVFKHDYFAFIEYRGHHRAHLLSECNAMTLKVIAVCVLCCVV